MESSFKLGRIAGIEIGVHYTWIFAFLLVAWSLAVGYFPPNYPRWSTTTHWLLAIAATVALFASVLVHELSHSFVALALGQGVHSITLFIFGGVSNLTAEAKNARDEFLVAVVGPASSLVLAGLFWLAQQATEPGPSPTPVGAFFGYLAFVNLALALFNLVPGFPLDGGRVLRSLLWGASGSMRQATQIATYVGQGFGFLMIFYGVSQILSGNFINGLWIAFIGWFLNTAAEGTRRGQSLKESLGGVRVAEIMDRTPPITAPDMTVAEFVYDHLLREGERAMLVQQDGRLVGLVSITDAKRVPQDVWASTPVGEIMTPTPLKTVSPETEMAQALELLVDGTVNQLPVVENGRVVGMLRRADLLRFLQLRDELGLRGRR